MLDQKPIEIMIIHKVSLILYRPGLSRPLCSNSPASRASQSAEVAFTRFSQTGSTRAVSGFFPPWINVQGVQAHKPWTPQVWPYRFAAIAYPDPELR